MLVRSTMALAAALALTITSCTVPTASGADEVSRVVLADPTGDVWASGTLDDEYPWHPFDAPWADATRAVVRHGDHFVWVKMSFTDLRRKHRSRYYADIRTPKKSRLASLGTGPGHWKGQEHLTGKARCPGFTHSISYAGDHLRMRIPRRCLGRPRWVRATLLNYSTGKDSHGHTQTLTDNPHNSDAGEPAPGIHTRRIYRPE